MGYNQALRHLDSTTQHFLRGLQREGSQPKTVTLSRDATGRYWINSITSAHRRRCPHHQKVGTAKWASTWTSPPAAPAQRPQTQPEGLDRCHCGSRRRKVAKPHTTANQACSG